MPQNNQSDDAASRISTFYRILRKRLRDICATPQKGKRSDWSTRSEDHGGSKSNNTSWCPFCRLPTSQCSDVNALSLETSAVPHVRAAGAARKIKDVPRVLSFFVGRKFPVISSLHRQVPHERRGRINSKRNILACTIIAERRRVLQEGNTSCNALLV